MGWSILMKLQRPNTEISYLVFLHNEAFISNIATMKILLFHVFCEYLLTI